MSFDEGFGKTGFARRLLLLRFRRLKLNQSDFAERFGLTFGAVKDAEQARHRPSRAMRVLVAAIDLNPELMVEAARIARAQEADDAE